MKTQLTPMEAARAMESASREFDRAAGQLAMRHYRAIVALVGDEAAGELMEAYAAWERAGEQFHAACGVAKARDER